MAGYCDLRSFVQTCVLLAFLVAVHVAEKEICDKTKCPGPLKYYKELGCAPVYKNPGDCCAERYNCNHLKDLSKDKCYVNGYEYSIGEHLRYEDKNPCDIRCVCRFLINETAGFACATIDLPHWNVQPNCFLSHSPSQCFAGPVICLKEGEMRATCEVDGKTYLDGEYFSPQSDPDKDCYCMPGYTGENVEPFCKKPIRSGCSPLFNDAEKVHQNCVPLFHSGQNLQTDCNIIFICENDIHNIFLDLGSTKPVSEGENMICQIGNTLMPAGSSFSIGIYYDIMRCVCEVPPIPTCQVDEVHGGNPYDPYGIGNEFVQTSEAYEL